MGYAAQQPESDGLVGAQLLYAKSLNLADLLVEPCATPTGQFQVILVMPGYGLIPVPPHLRHLTILSPFLRVPFPSQFLHLCFFCPVFFRTQSSKVHIHVGMPTSNDGDFVNGLELVAPPTLQVVVGFRAPAKSPATMLIGVAEAVR
jgi:hypothetical protein